MSVTKLRSEKGGIVLSLLFFVVFLGIMGTAITTLSVAEHRAQNVYRQERSLFYAAQSGLEYGVKRFLQSDVTNLADRSETVDVGGGMTADVEMQIVGSDKVQISVDGGSGQFKKQLGATITYIDVSEYAVYTAGQVQHVITKKDLFGPNYPSLTYQNAPVMPIFDLDELRNTSQPFGYYKGDLTINSGFDFPANRMVFVEGDLTFHNIGWYHEGHFTALGNTLLNSSVAQALAYAVTIYQPNPNSNFEAERSVTLLGRNIWGGIIAAGNINGSTGYSFPWWMGELRVIYKRATIISFMNNSLNGGPLIIEKTKWENFN